VFLCIFLLTFTIFLFQIGLAWQKKKPNLFQVSFIIPKNSEKSNRIKGIYKINRPVTGENAENACKKHDIFYYFYI